MLDAGADVLLDQDDHFDGGSGKKEGVGGEGWRVKGENLTWVSSNLRFVCKALFVFFNFFLFVYVRGKKTKLSFSSITRRYEAQRCFIRFRGIDLPRTGFIRFSLKCNPEEHLTKINFFLAFFGFFWFFWKIKISFRPELFLVYVFEAIKNWVYPIFLCYRMSILSALADTIKCLSEKKFF